MKKKKENHLPDRITIRIPEGLHGQIIAGCELIGVKTPSAFVRIAIRTFLKGFGFKPKG